MKRNFCAALLASTAALTGAGAALAQSTTETPSAPSQLFVFGDSSVEQGNLYATPGFERPGSPYFTLDGFSRDSNGPVWVEYIAPDIKPVLGASRNANRVNFAYTGATSGPDNIVGLSGTGLLGQIETFSSRIAQGSPRPTTGSVAVIAAGVNDFIRDLGVVDLRTTSTQVIDNLDLATRRLSTLGVSRVLVEDAPNFIVAPEFNDLATGTDRQELVRVIGEFVEGHNAALVTALTKVNGELATADVVTVKISKLFDHVRANAAALGFKVTDQACYDEAAGTLCSADPSVQNDYLFFDNLHLTTRAQAIQADYYSALLGQLDGSAHAGPARLVRDAAETMRGEAQGEREARRAGWLNAAVPEGVSLIGDVGYRRVRDDGQLAASGDRSSFRLGLGYGDGDSWSARVVGARLRSDLSVGAGTSRLDGWSVSASGERRWGGLRLGASVSHYAGDAEGKRRIPVALMTTDWSSRVSGTSAEIEAGYHYRKGPVSLMPSAWARLERTRLESHGEKGETGLEMSFTGRAFEAVYAGLGATAAYDASSTIRPRLSASYERRLTPSAYDLTGRLTDNSADAIVAQVRPFQLQAVSVEPGVDVALGGASLSLNGSAHLDRREYGVAARISFRF